MFEETADYHFKMMYLMKNSNLTVHEDMVAGSLGEVMAYLKGKGVNKNSVQSLFVHQITKDGIAELVTIDNTQAKEIKNIIVRDDKPPFSGPTSPVASLAAARAKAAERATKPHIKLKASDLEEKRPPVVTQGLYQAVCI